MAKAVEEAIIQIGRLQRPKLPTLVARCYDGHSQCLSLADGAGRAKTIMEMHRQEYTRMSNEYSKARKSAKSEPCKWITASDTGKYLDLCADNLEKRYCNDLLLKGQNVSGSEWTQLSSALRIQTIWKHCRVEKDHLLPFLAAHKAEKCFKGAFYIPEIDEEGFIIVDVEDGPHLLKRLRSMIVAGLTSKGGASSDGGVLFLASCNTKAWKAVLDRGEGNLKAKHLDGTDPQSVALAVQLFTAEVEASMRKAGDQAEADFCFMMRSWWHAIDKRGLSFQVRLQRIRALRDCLLLFLKDVLMSRPSRSICGLSRQLFEGLLIHCEARLLLSDELKRICGNPVYNSRSLSTDHLENFFSMWVQLLGRKPTATEAEYLWAKLVFETNKRLCPDRRWTYFTSKKVKGLVRTLEVGGEKEKSKLEKKGVNRLNLLATNRNYSKLRGSGLSLCTISDSRNID